jgi:tetratricopeptide (TPR) repeat protein
MFFSSPQYYWKRLPFWVVLFLVAAELLAQGSQTVEEDAMRQIQNGDFQSASKLLKEQLRRYPNRVELWNLLGIAETELNQPESAEQAFKQGLAIAPRSVSLSENIGFLFYREKNYPKAKQYLQSAVELGSRNPGVRFSLAACRLRTGEEAKALTELNALEPALKGVSDYWEERGRAELPNDAARAESSFNHALDLKPNSLVALNGAAAAAEKQGLDEKALAYLVRARTAAPDDVATLTHFGEVCIRRDLGPDARDALARAHRLQPSNNSVLYYLARANISLENWQQAYDLFNQLSKRAPDFAPAYYAMGWLDTKLNRPDDARLKLKHALALAPGLSGARYELAKLDLDSGNIDTAEKLLQIVLKENPNDANANMTMGDIMERKGNSELAVTLLEKAIRQDPNLAAAHYKLSMIYFRKHDTERAEREKNIAANLIAKQNRASKTQLRLVLPEASDIH